MRTYALYALDDCKGPAHSALLTCEQLMSMAVGILMNSVSVMTITDQQSVVNLRLCRASNLFCWNAKGDRCVSPFLISILSVLLQEVCQKGQMVRFDTRMNLDQ